MGGGERGTCCLVAPFCFIGKGAGCAILMGVSGGAFALRGKRSLRAGGALLGFVVGVDLGGFA